MLINEKKLPTVGEVKKTIKGLNLDYIHPEFFSVEKKNTNAGMGGYDYIFITFDYDAGQSKKRIKDFDKVIMTLGNKYDIDRSNIKNGYITIS